LRSAQHFDALEIQEVHDRAGRPAEHDVVDVETDRRLARRFEITITEAANVGGDCRPITLTELVDRDVRRPRADVERARGAVGGQVGCGQCRDRERNLLQVLCAKPRRDDDFLEPACLLAAALLCDESF
jgi:hypothetical protein